MTQNKFWLVWSPQGKVTPTEIYNSINLAKQKAQELANAIQENEFYVLEATHHFKTDVIETSFEAKPRPRQDGYRHA